MIVERAAGGMLVERVDLRPLIAPAGEPLLLACRCGRALTLAAMRRPAGLRPGGAGDAARIDPIVCDGCAAAASALAAPPTGEVQA